MPKGSTAKNADWLIRVGADLTPLRQDITSLTREVKDLLSNLSKATAQAAKAAKSGSPQNAQGHDARRRAAAAEAATEEKISKRRQIVQKAEISILRDMARARKDITASQVEADSKLSGHIAALKTERQEIERVAAAERNAVQQRERGLQSDRNRAAIVAQYNGAVRLATTQEEKLRIELQKQRALRVELARLVKLGGPNQAQNVGLLTEASAQVRQLEKQIRGSVPSITGITGLDKGFSAARKSLGAIQKALIGTDESLFKIIGKVGIWTVSTGVVFGTMRGIQRSLQLISEIDFEEAGIAKVLRTSEDATRDARILTLEAGRMGALFGASITDVQKQMQQFARQGYQVNEIVSLTTKSLLLQKAANIDAADSARLLTAIMKQYELSVHEVGVEVDALNELENRFAAEAKEIAEGVSRSATAARSIKVEYEELNAIIATLIETTGRPGAEIGRNLNTILARLYKPEAKKALQELGIGIEGQSGQLKDGFTLLQELAAKWDYLTEAQQRNLSITLAETRRSVELISLMQKFPRVLEGIGIQYGSMNSAAEEAARRMDTIQGKLERLRTVLQALVQDANSDSNLSDFIKNQLDVLIGALERAQKLDFDKIQRGIGSIVTVLSALAGARVGVGAIAGIGALGLTVHPAIAAVTVALGALGAVLVKLKLQQDLFAGSVRDSSGAMSEQQKRLNQYSEHVATMFSVIGAQQEYVRQIGFAKQQLKELSDAHLSEVETAKRRAEIMGQLDVAIARLTESEKKAGVEGAKVNLRQIESDKLRHGTITQTIKLLDEQIKITRAASEEEIRAAIKSEEANRNRLVAALHLYEAQVRGLRAIQQYTLPSADEVRNQGGPVAAVRGQYSGDAIRFPYQQISQIRSSLEAQDAAIRSLRRFLEDDASSPEPYVDQSDAARRTQLSSGGSVRQARISALTDGQVLRISDEVVANLVRLGVTQNEFLDRLILEAVGRAADRLAENAQLSQGASQNVQRVLDLYDKAKEAVDTVRETTSDPRADSLASAAVEGLKTIDRQANECAAWVSDVAQKVAQLDNWARGNAGEILRRYKRLANEDFRPGDLVGNLGKPYGGTGTQHVGIVGPDGQIYESFAGREQAVPISTYQQRYGSNLYHARPFGGSGARNEATTASNAAVDAFNAALEGLSDQERRQFEQVRLSQSQRDEFQKQAETFLGIIVSGTFTSLDELLQEAARRGVSAGNARLILADFQGVLGDISSALADEVKSYADLLGVRAEVVQAGYGLTTDQIAELRNRVARLRSQQSFGSSNAVDQAAQGILTLLDGVELILKVGNTNAATRAAREQGASLASLLSEQDIAAVSEALFAHLDFVAKAVTALGGDASRLGNLRGILQSGSLKPDQLVALSHVLDGLMEDSAELQLIGQTQRTAPNDPALKQRMDAVNGRIMEAVARAADISSQAAAGLIESASQRVAAAARSGNIEAVLRRLNALRGLGRDLPDSMQQQFEQAVAEGTRSLQEVRDQIWENMTGGWDRLRQKFDGVQAIQEQIRQDDLDRITDDAVRNITEMQLIILDNIDMLRIIGDQDPDRARRLREQNSDLERRLRNEAGNLGRTSQAVISSLVSGQFQNGAPSELETLLGLLGAPGRGRRRLPAGSEFATGIDRTVAEELLQFDEKLQAATRAIEQFAGAADQLGVSGIGDALTALREAAPSMRQQYRQSIVDQELGRRLPALDLQIRQTQRQTSAGQFSLMQMGGPTFLNQLQAIEFGLQQRLTEIREQALEENAAAYPELAQRYYDMEVEAARQASTEIASLYKQRFIEVRDTYRDFFSDLITDITDLEGSFRRLAGRILSRSIENFLERDTPLSGFINQLAATTDRGMNGTGRTDVIPAVVATTGLLAGVSKSKAKAIMSPLTVQAVSNYSNAYSKLPSSATQARGIPSFGGSSLLPQLIGLAGIGFQGTGSTPLAGALGGAVSGFALGGPVGAAIGGVAGLLGGLFGRRRTPKPAAQDETFRLPSSQDVRYASPVFAPRSAYLGGRAGGTSTNIVFDNFQVVLPNVRNAAEARIAGEQFAAGISAHAGDLRESRRRGSNARF